VGVMSAVQAAKRSRVAMEMHQISLALETYKNKFGEYPPDLYDKAAVVRHVKKRWPRFDLYYDPSDVAPGVTKEDLQYWSLLNAVKNVYRHKGKVDMLKLYDNINANYYFMNDDTATPTFKLGVHYIGALPFWLGGFPNPDGKFAGFSADPTAPFGKSNAGTNDGSYTVAVADIADSTKRVELINQDKDSVFYEMIIGKNIAYVTTTDNVIFPVLINRDATVNKNGTNPVPYIYFRGSSSGGQTAYTYKSGSSPNVYTSKYYSFTSTFAGSPWSELGLVSAYARSGNPSVADPTLSWMESERFQLIHSGLDGVFGGGTQREARDNVLLDSSGTDQFHPSYFRSINTNFSPNDIGQKDFDNITNFSDYQQIKSILP
jgi:hypothetical protein